jgi:hypothetical protein
LRAKPPRQAKDNIDIDAAADDQAMSGRERNLDASRFSGPGRFDDSRHRIVADLDRQKRCRFPARAKPWIAAPLEHHVGVEPVQSRDLGH